MTVMLRGKFVFLNNNTNSNCTHDLSQIVPYTNVVPFNRLYTLINTHSVTENITFTPNLIDKVIGAVTIVKLVSDGTSTISFTGIKEVNSSVGYDNTLNILNYLAFFYDGSEFFVNIYQEKNAQPVDIVPPILQTATLETSDKNKIILTYDEDLDGTKIPNISDFTVSGGKTVTGITIVDKIVTVTVNTDYELGDTITVSYVPGIDKLQDSNGNEVVALTDQAVTNNISAI